jgi:predicted nucleic acid-binding protein
VTGRFLDTSGLYAAADPRERAHPACRDELERSLRGGQRLVTTDLVLAELHALALSRSGPATAHELGRRVSSSDRIELVVSGIDRLDAALDLLLARGDKRYSLTDAVSFVVMRELDLAEALTLDADFRAEGFATVPAV